MCKRVIPETPIEETAPPLKRYFFDPHRRPSQTLAFFEGFLFPGDIAVWVGREKDRKSNLVLQFAICAAVGLPFLFFEFIYGRPLKVVLIDYETKTGSLKRRYESICRSIELTREKKRLLYDNLQIIEGRRLIRAGHTLPRFHFRSSRAAQDNPDATEARRFWSQLGKDYPADIYIFDPMRSMHSGDENDSAIEGFLASIRQVFCGSAVIIVHHMRKRNLGGRLPKLEEDMRLWSDDARGSGAIKAHADAIICQERKEEDGVEVVRLGAFSKDAPDVDPIPLEESDAESFYWVARPDLPAHLQESFGKLKKRRPSTFRGRAAAVHALERSGWSRASAYRHVNQLVQRGFLVEDDRGLLRVVMENANS